MPKPRGRHPHHRLTVVQVRALRPGRHADGNGLYLLVEPSGARRWLLRTNVAGKRTELGLGGVQLTSLAEAREEARRLRKIARAGGNPVLERRRARQVVPTFTEAALTVHAAHAPGFRNVKHRADWISSLEMYVFPHFGERRVDEIESADVLTALGAIWLTRPETARRVKQRVRAVFDWCKASGYRTGDNPVEGTARVLPKHTDAPVHHAALPYAAVPAWLVRLRASDASETVRLAFELLILTALRTSEVIGARWEEVDLAAALWVVPAARMKKKREHRVPLAPRAVAILERARGLAGDSPFVFPGRWSHKPLSNMAFLMTLRRLGEAEVTAHGFRSAFRDWCAERTTFPRAVVEMALAHVVENKTEAAYFRSDLLEQRRALMSTWAAFLSASPADVVPLRA